jgi:hypothetical protein
MFRVICRNDEEFLKLNLFWLHYFLGSPQISLTLSASLSPAPIHHEEFLGSPTSGSEWNTSDDLFTLRCWMEPRIKNVPEEHK